MVNKMLKTASLFNGLRVYSVTDGRQSKHDRLSLYSEPLKQRIEFYYRITG